MWCIFSHWRSCLRHSLSCYGQHYNHILFLHLPIGVRVGEEWKIGLLCLGLLSRYHECIISGTRQSQRAPLAFKKRAGRDRFPLRLYHYCGIVTCSPYAIQKTEPYRRRDSPPATGGRFWDCARLHCSLYGVTGSHFSMLMNVTR